ncbi:MAG: class I SAM-dependent methyltransferase [Euryarchaeota archaeon]|nr:class I SAM-dependent methyltransferase [Euryarchaeota archaeon]MDE1838147.1 class I SAM-dependent methyltransferase [Euryarchaeota archaeon]MDE1880333.1 class I SAM-dependent methyltransferase [Euryarchaeota archaeon]MDE2046354.1 class I SAM-dependent methyltransferase [Thermoplasmata archaeon]
MVWFALRHPRQAWQFLRAPSALSHLLGGLAAPAEIKGWMREAGAVTQEINRRLHEASWKPGQSSGSTDSQDRGPVLYAVTRALRPTVVLETGVANGSSTYYFLSAMKANGKGTLHSIDLPPGTDTTSEYHKADMTAIAQGHGSGWLVPAELRAPWTLHLGDTRKVLPKVLESTPKLDLFFHDSEHTYEAMTFEFNSAWPCLQPGGVLGSDDVGWNRSFFDFVAANHLPTVRVGGFGWTRKPLPLKV